MYRKKILFILISLLVFSPIVGCKPQQPILIGFSGELTGRRAELGRAARDGAQLAVDQINEAGGVNGRPLQLLVRDDEGSPDIARQVDQELIEAGVMAIIGHVTSEQTSAVFNEMNKAKVVLISPTSSSSYFSSKVDFFFRMMPSNETAGESLAKHIYKNRGVRKLTGVYDIDNQAFTETLWQSIQKKFTLLGGDARQVFSFDSKDPENQLQDLIAEIKLTQPEAVLFIASAIDTALMVQYSRQQNLDALLFSSSWAQTNELLEKGGRAVDGLELGAYYDPGSQSESFLQFVEQFEARYQRSPSLGASHAYESILCLAEALKISKGEITDLAKALTGLKIKGVQGEIELDQFGDVRRDVYIVRIEAGRYATIAVIHPEPK